MKKKSFERKNELIEAALDEFTTKRYGNASLNKIIKNAEISKGTFYYNFKDKQALYIFLHQLAYKKGLDFMDRRIKEIAEDFEKMDIFEKFKMNTIISIEYAAAFPKYMKLTHMFMKEEGNKENKEIFDYINSFRKKSINNGVEQMITVAIEDGDFNDKFSKEFISKVINHLFINYTEIFPIKQDYDYGDAKFLDHINNFIDFLKYGLSKR